MARSRSPRKRRKLPVYPVPEAITSENWEIVGVDQGGSVEVNVSEDRKRKMRVPLIDSPAARHIRAHEMAHAQISPRNPVFPKDVANKAIQRAEDMRMNMHCRRKGLDAAMDAPLLVTDEAKMRLVTDPMYSGDLVAVVSAACATYRTGDWPIVMGIVREIDATLADQIEAFIPNLWDYLNSKPDVQTTAGWARAMRNARAIMDFCKAPDNPNPNPDNGEAGEGSDDSASGDESTDSGSDGSEGSEGSEESEDQSTDASDGSSDGSDGSDEGSDGSEGSEGSPDGSDESEQSSGQDSTEAHDGFGGGPDDMDEIIDEAIRAADEDSKEEDPEESGSHRTCEEVFADLGYTEENGALAHTSSKWPEMTIERPSLTERLPGSKLKGRAKVPSDNGRIPRYMGRYCADKSVFEANGKRRGGGAILIDASSSLSLTNADIDRILDEAPAATIATYCGQGQAEAGLRIIARYGKRVARGERLKPHGYTNSVDGPALRWLSKIQGDKYWVCDGLINNGSAAGIDLIRECDAIVRKYRIDRVESVDELIQRIHG